MSNAHIDKASVEQLRNNFSRNSGAINSSLNSVENYLRDIQSSIKQDLQVIYERLKKAEEKLSAAEAALDRCERSQKWDEEKKEYRPSCSSEHNSVKNARSDYEQYKSIFDRANNIVTECNREIDGYHQNTKNILTELCKTSQNASSVLNVILSKVDEYRNENASLGSVSITTGYSIDGSGKSYTTTQHKTESSKQDSEEEKKRKRLQFERGTAELKERMRLNSNICSVCKQVKPCKCGGFPREEQSRERRDILSYDYSREIEAEKRRAREREQNREQAYNRLSGETRTTVRPTSQNNQTVSSFFLNKGRER